MSYYSKSAENVQGLAEKNSSERKTSTDTEQAFFPRISFFNPGYRGGYPQSMAANSLSFLLLWITSLVFSPSPLPGTTTFAIITSV